MPETWTNFVESESPAGWNDLINFRPPASVQFRVDSDPLDARVQALEGAAGDLSLDYYPVKIWRFPLNTTEPWGPQPRHTPTSLLETFRRAMPHRKQREFWDPDLTEFSPHSDVERKRWRGKPLGTVLHIDMKAWGGLLNVKDGSVVCSGAEQTRFRVSTVKILNDFYHPVSGTREWGVWRSGSKAGGVDRIDWKTGRHYELSVDEWTFYTRAADRVSTSLFNVNGSAVFSGADKLWKTLQERMAAFVNDNGGRAVVGDRISKRHEWDKIATFHFNPSTPWAVEPA